MPDGRVNFPHVGISEFEEFYLAERPCSLFGIGLIGDMSLLLDGFKVAFAPMIAVRAFDSLRILCFFKTVGPVLPTLVVQLPFPVLFFLENSPQKSRGLEPGESFLLHLPFLYPL